MALELIDRDESVPCLFERSRFHARQIPVAHARVSASPRAFRNTIRSRVPNAPGVYAMVDRSNEIAYIGKSIELRDRVLNYFADHPSLSFEKPRGRKEHQVGGLARKLIWQPVGHELVALLRELELIQLLRPRLNVRGAVGRGPVGYVCLTGDEAPTLRAAKRPPARARRSWGPLLLSKQVRNAIDHANYHFGLRDCSVGVSFSFLDQKVLWDDPPVAGCLRSELGSCLAPCAAACTRSDYGNAVRQLIVFLDGDDAVSLGNLSRDMRAAATTREFERAGRLRDRLEALNMLQSELTLVRDRLQDHSGRVLEVPDASGRVQWLVFSAGVVVLSVAKPESAEEQRRALEILARHKREGTPLHGLPASFECESARLVTSWFAQDVAATDQLLELDELIENCQRLRFDAA